jgi:hypothetical protein
VESTAYVTALWGWVAAHPVKRSLLLLFCTVLLTEIVLRVFAPKSRAAQAWTAFFTRVSQSRVLQFLAKFWTGVILSIVYFFTVALVSAFMKVFGDDPLDRSLKPEPTFWRKHDPNPLGPQAAARHQF